jgi:hypothetical protein
MVEPRSRDPSLVTTAASLVFDGLCRYHLSDPGPSSVPNTVQIAAKTMRTVRPLTSWVIT